MKIPKRRNKINQYIKMYALECIGMCVYHIKNMPKHVSRKNDKNVIKRSSKLSSQNTFKISLTSRKLPNSTNQTLTSKRRLNSC